MGMGPQFNVAENGKSGNLKGVERRGSRGSGGARERRERISLQRSAVSLQSGERATWAGRPRDSRRDAGATNSTHISFLASRNISVNISSVNFPVLVFWLDGW